MPITPIDGLVDSKFTEVYFDANTLVAAHWPEGSKILHGFLHLATSHHVRLHLPILVEMETAALWERQFKHLTSQASAKLKSLEGHATPDTFRASDVLERLPDLEPVLADYRKRCNTLKADIGFIETPFPSSSLLDLVEQSTRHAPPFRDDDRGFRDSLIALSILEDCKRHGNPTVVLTMDKEFTKFLRRAVPAKVPLGITDLENAFEHIVERELDLRQENWRANRLRVAAALSKDADSLRQAVESGVHSELPRTIPNQRGEIREVNNVSIVGEASVVLPWGWDGVTEVPFGAVVPIEADGVIAEPPPLSLASLYALASYETASTGDLVPPIVVNRTIRVSVTIEGRVRATADGGLEFAYNRVRLSDDHSELVERYMRSSAT